MKNRKIANFIKGIKRQNRFIDSFLEEQRIGVALPDSFFLNRAHHWAEAYLQKYLQRLAEGVRFESTIHVCVCVCVGECGYNLVPDFHPNFAATIGRAPDIANRIRTNFLTATGNTFHHQEARRWSNGKEGGEMRRNYNVAESSSLDTCWLLLIPNSCCVRSAWTMSPTHPV